MNEGIDLAALEERVRALPQVTAVARYSTLCSEQGRVWLAEDLAAHREDVVVMAACSPREHGPTFMEACRQGGVNPYRMAIANIREQCAWVTAGRHAAALKAERLIRSAVARACVQRPLPESEIECSTDVLVVGAGVAGLSAAHQLARGGRRVVLVERTPAIGGRVGLLGEVFPNMECSSCMIGPLMDEILHHPSIQTFTYSEVESVKGSFGNFIVRIRKRARHVDAAGCYGCRTCHTACPVDVPNEFDFGLSRRNAVYMPYTGALPNASTVMAKTRGAAAALVDINEDEMILEFVGIGNIEFRGVSKERISPVSIPGIVGTALRRIRSFRYKVNDNDLFIVFSDGISSRFALEEYRDLTEREAAERVLREFGKSHDDATCVVVRLNGHASCPAGQSNTGRRLT